MEIMYESSTVVSIMQYYDKSHEYSIVIRLLWHFMVKYFFSNINFNPNQ